MKDDRLLLRLEKLEGLDQLAYTRARQAVRSTSEAELLKKHRGPQHPLGRLFGFADKIDRGLARQPLQHSRRAAMQVAHVLVGNNLVQIARNRASVSID